MAKKTTSKKTTTKKTAGMPASTPTTKKAAAKKTTPNKSAANLKAIAAADQANATKRDQRAASADGMTPSERAMAETEPTKRRGRKPESKTAADSAGGEAMTAFRNVNAGKPRSGLDLAATVLADAGEPLNAKRIAERAIAAGWKTSGKTPHATLYSAMTREIQNKGDASRFRKIERGLFAAGPDTKPDTKPDAKPNAKPSSKKGA